MENNNENNIGVNTEGGVVKKNKTFTIIVIVVVIALAVVVAMYVKKLTTTTDNSAPISESDKQLNQAVTSDTTASINASINSITVDDTTSADLSPVDQELNKL